MSRAGPPSLSWLFGPRESEAKRSAWLLVTEAAGVSPEERRKGSSAAAGFHALHGPSAQRRTQNACVRTITTRTLSPSSFLGLIFLLKQPPCVLISCFQPCFMKDQSHRSWLSPWRTSFSSPKWLHALFLRFYFNLRAHIDRLISFCALYGPNLVVWLISKQKKGGFECRLNPLKAEQANKNTITRTLRNVVLTFWNLNRPDLTAL